MSIRIHTNRKGKVVGTSDDLSGWLGYRISCLGEGLGGLLFAFFVPVITILLWKYNKNGSFTPRKHPIYFILWNLIWIFLMYQIFILKNI